MDTSSSFATSSGPQAAQSFEDAVLKAKVAHICDHVGYHAITQDSSNILVDIYRRLVYHLARHCHEAATNNRRIETTPLDLIQAFQFVGIPIADLSDYIKNVKLNHVINFDRDKDHPSNKIQRNLLVDDQLDIEKNIKNDDHDEENKAIIENDNHDEQKPLEPSLKDTYQEISNKFTDCKPVTADKKIKIGSRIVFKNAPPAPLESDKPYSELEKPNTVTVVDKKIKNKIKSPEETAPKIPLKKSIEKKSKDTKRAKIARKKSKTQKTVATEESNTNIPSSPISKPKSEDKVTKAKGAKKGPKQSVGKQTNKLTHDTTSVSPDLDEILDTSTKSKNLSRKKLKTSHVTPLDLLIAEPPSFLHILEPNNEEPSPDKSPHEAGLSMLAHIGHAKQTKQKKKRKTTNQFAIVTETVTATDEKEWLCPGCGGPDDGDVMVQCDNCEEWYHLGCTNLKKAPDDDENWECEICIKKTKADTTKIRTPDPPVVKIEPMSVPLLPGPSVTQPIQGASQDELCPECSLPDDGTLMILCDDPDCAKWFHGKCVNLLEEPKETESWFCKACVDKQQSAFQRRRRPK